MRRIAHRALQRLGVEVVRYLPRNYAHLRRGVLLREEGVTLALDVGAFVGGYGRELRRQGYRGRIVSFEPHAQAFALLVRRAESDPKWHCLRVAVGDRVGTAVLNVAGDDARSSSLLPMRARLRAAAPETVFVDEEAVELTRLDALYPDLVDDGDVIFLKLDVQGYELPALRGGQRTLAQARLLEVELSVVPLYKGQALLPEVVAYLNDAGFELVALDRSFYDTSNGDLLQLNGLFRRAC